MKRLLWLDDYRNPLENDWLVFSPIGRDVEISWIKSYQEFASWIHLFPIIYVHELQHALRMGGIEKKIEL